MAKNIIICSDGTGNRGGKTHDTNVWRLYNGLDLNNNQQAQVRYYDDGVGTEDNKYLRAIGAGVGWGFTRNVKQAYKFLCLNYDKDDRIYMFGFSRGAYTVRALAAFVVYAGVIEGALALSEGDLDREIDKRVKQYFKNRKDNQLKASGVQIHFLGVWDTVGALGVPRDFPLREPLLKSFFKFYFKDHDLHKNVVHACQALALDDQHR